MNRFQVDTYFVRTRRSTPTAPARRVIGVVGLPGLNGQRPSALLRFREQADLPPGLGDVSNVGTPGLAEALVAYFHTSDFDATYRILQTEKPAFVFYKVPEAGGPTRPIEFLEVGTGLEPVGELVG